MIRQIESVNCLKDVQASDVVSEETYGAHSRCFEWREKASSIIIPQCHSAKVRTFNSSSSSNPLKCEDGVVKIKLESGINVVCRYDKEVVDLDDNYEFVCPKIADFCTDWTHRCPLDCNGNGICTGTKTCICFEGYTGDDCVSLCFDNDL